MPNFPSPDEWNAGLDRVGELDAVVSITIPYSFPALDQV
jgi:hypothetical protein